MRRTNQATVFATLVLLLLTIVGCDYDATEEGRNYLVDEMIVDSTADNPLCYVPSSNNDGTLMVTWHRDGRLGADGYTYSGKIVIPEEITYGGKTYKVTGIDTWAFALSPISSVTIPETISYIGEESFTRCTSLKSITLPSSITMIPNGTFAGSKLSSFIFNDAVTSVGRKAFLNCSSLTSVEFDNNSSLMKLDEYSFYGCSKLQKVTLPAGVSEIGAYSFSQCSKLSELHLKSTTPPTLSDSIITSKVKLFVPKGSKTAYESNELWNKFTSITEE